MRSGNLSQRSKNKALSDSSDQTEFPTQGALFGIDYGSRRVGIAISTFEQTIASPLETYTRCNDDVDARSLAELADEYRIAGLVVGLPVHMSGDEGKLAQEAREFGRWAAAATGRPVCFWDERFTSSIAEEYLQAADLTKKKRKARIDKLAAQIMLQSLLDSDDRTARPQSI